MASLPTRTTASFAAIAPVPSLDPLDDEFDQYVGAAGILNGGTTGTKLLIKTSDANDPPIEQDQVGAGPLAEWKQNGTLKASINNSGTIVSAISTGTAPITVTSTTACTNLNADMVDGIEGANIARLDTDKIAWSASWFIENPNDFGGVGADSEFVRLRIPKGGVTVTGLAVCFQSGSHAGSSSLQYTLNKRTSADDWATPAAAGNAVQINDTNATIQKVYSATSFSVSFAEGDTLGLQFSGQTGTHNERKISVMATGVRGFTT